MTGAAAGSLGPQLLLVEDEESIGSLVRGYLEQSGFRLRQVETGYLATFPRAWTYCWWGTAVPSRKVALPTAV